MSPAAACSPGALHSAVSLEVDRDPGARDTRWPVLADALGGPPKVVPSPRGARTRLDVGFAGGRPGAPADAVSSGCVSRLRDIVPAGRRYLSDFKCPCPGPDEAELLLELAALARLAVVRARGEYDGARLVTLHVEAEGARDRVEVRREKYLFPPTPLLEYLNGLLARWGEARRLVACADGGDEAVVWVDAAERAALVAAGVRVHGG